jgi:hypothetical protein
VIDVRTLSRHVSAQRCVTSSDFLWQRGSEHRFVRSLLTGVGVQTGDAATGNTRLNANGYAGTSLNVSPDFPFTRRSAELPFSSSSAARR